MSLSYYSKKKKKIKVFEICEPRKVFGPNNEEIVGMWEKTALISNVIIYS
jgi:hypothetical protein